MLACNFDGTKRQLSFFAKKSLLIQPKLDGIRCQIFGKQKLCEKTNSMETVFARSGKRLPNNALRELLRWLPGFDGEIVGRDTAKSYEQASHYAMSHNVLPDSAHISFVCFNYFGDGSQEYCQRSYEQRMRDARMALQTISILFPQLAELVEIVDSIECDSLEQALLESEKLAAAGAEGAMLTCKEAPYLWRRCKQSEPWVAKLKAIAYCEAICLDVLPGKYSFGESIPEELRGTIKHDEAGALLCKSPEFMDTFQVGSGLTQAQRISFMANPAQLEGEVLRIKYLPIGSKTRPRQPIFAGFRDKIDIADEALDELQEIASEVHSVFDEDISFYTAEETDA